MHAVETEDSPSGVLVVGAVPYQAIAAPILSPTLVGWVVFASRLDAREMHVPGAPVGHSPRRRRAWP